MTDHHPIAVGSIGTGKAASLKVAVANQLVTLKSPIGEPYAHTPVFYDPLTQIAAPRKPFVCFADPGAGMEAGFTAARDAQQLLTTQAHDTPQEDHHDR